MTDPASGVRTLSFDPSTYLVSADRNEAGDTTTFAYCPAGDAVCPEQRLKSATAPEGNAVAYEYDARSNATKTTASPKQGSPLTPIVTSASYPVACVNAKTCNKPVSTTDVQGATTDYTYDPAHGGVLSVTAPAATAGAVRAQVRYGYAALTGGVSGDPVYVPTGTSLCRTAASCAGTADETKTATGYAAANLLAVSQTASSGDGALAVGVTLAYDAVGNVTSADGPLPGSGYTMRVSYDALRRAVTRTRAGPNAASATPYIVTRTTFDAQGRAERVAIGTGDANGASFTPAQSVTTSYDGYDRPTVTTLEAGGAVYGRTQYSYDALGRPECVAVRMNAGAWGSLPASACTLQATGAAGEDRVARTQYDAAGQVTGVTSAYGTAAAANETRGYGANGELEWASDANGNRTSYAYDGFGRIARKSYPVATVGANASNKGDYEQLTYDAGGNVTQRRLRDGQTLYYSYDALGRRTYDDNPNTNVAEVDVSYTYDLLGHVMRAQDQNGWYAAYEYDALGRTTRQYSNIYGNRFAYDAAGRRTLQTWDDGFFVTTDYLVTGETSAIRENWGLSLATFGYDDLGRRTSLTRANGTVTGYSYDAASRLSGLTQDLTGTSADLSLGFGYNPAGQITTRIASNDAYSWGGAVNVDRPYVVNGLNQYTQSGGVTPTYDARGNLTQAGGQSYVYNTRNQLFATGTAGQLFYRNPTGVLGQINVNVNGRNLDYVGQYLTTELNGATGAVFRRYVYGPGEDEPLVWYEGSGNLDRRYLHADERGSVIALSDNSGTVTAINTYDEYGIPGTGNVGTFQYTGQKWIAELGMYDYKARMYSPTLGRFLQTDPIGYGDGMNWYNYVGGDPVNGTDPSGLTCTGSLFATCPGTISGFTSTGYPNGYGMDSNDAIDQISGLMAGGISSSIAKQAVGIWQGTNGNLSAALGTATSRETTRYPDDIVVVANAIQRRHLEESFSATTRWWNIFEDSSETRKVETAIFMISVGSSQVPGRTAMTPKQLSLPKGTGDYYYRYEVPGLSQASRIAHQSGTTVYYYSNTHGKITEDLPYGWVEIIFNVGK